MSKMAKMSISLTIHSINGHNEPMVAIRQRVVLTLSLRTTRKNILMRDGNINFYYIIYKVSLSVYRDILKGNSHLQSSRVKVDHLETHTLIMKEKQEK